MKMTAKEHRAQTISLLETKLHEAQIEEKRLTKLYLTAKRKRIEYKDLWKQADDDLEKTEKKIGLAFV